MTDTWCVLPWIHMCVRPNNTLKPCCRYSSKSPSAEFTTGLDDVFSQGDAALNVPAFSSIRKKMLEGKRVSGCKKCYSQEAVVDVKNRPSLRQYMNERFASIKREDCTENFLQLRYLEMSIDNICNLQCKMCTSMFSSKLINRDKMLGNPVFKKLEPNFNKLDNTDLSNLEVVKILGGEPFITPNFEKFIDYLIERSNPANISLDIATNGTAIPSSRVIEKLNLFKNLYILVSLDSYSLANDYQRHGSSYQKVFDHAKEYEKLFDRGLITFHSVVTLLNANELANTLIFLTKKHNYHVSVDFVRDPQHLSLLYAPQTYCDWVLEQNKHNDTAYKLLESFVKQSRFNDQIWKSFINSIDTLDNYYKTDIEHFNPSLAEYLDKNSYKKLKV